MRKRGRIRRRTGAGFPACPAVGAGFSLRWRFYAGDEVGVSLNRGELAAADRLVVGEEGLGC